MNNNIPLRRTGTWLQSSSHELESVLKQVRQLSAIQQKILPLIDPALAPYCQVASVSQSKLVLLVANGSIATQLRFQSLDLLRKINQDPLLQNIRTIEYKVRPQSSSTRLQASTGKSMSALSTEAADAVAASAAYIEDSALREIMLKIAKHRQRKD